MPQIDELFPEKKPDELSQIFPEKSGEQRTIPETVVGGLETAAAVGSGMLAEPIAGLAGTARAALGLGESTPTERIEEVRESLTYQPRTESGQAGLRAVAETVEPIANALQSLQTALGESTFEATESPALAALAETIPAAASELLGYGAGARAAARASMRQAEVDAGDRAVRDVQATEAETGIQQLTTDVLPPESRVGQFAQQQGEIVAPSQRTTQQEQRVQAIDRTLSHYDVDDGANYQDAIVRSMKDQVSAEKSRLGEMYENSSRQLDQMGSVPLVNIRNFAQEFIAKESRLGPRADQAAITDMQEMLNLPDDLTFEEVKKIRSAIGSQLKSVQQGASILGTTDTAFLSRVYSQLSDDLQNFARTADPDLFDAWRQADQEYSSFITSADKTAVRRVIRQGDTTPEFVDTLLFSNKPSDVQFIANNLTPSGKEAAKQRVLQRALERSINPDTGEVSPNAFNRQLSRLDSQIGAIFEPYEANALRELNRVLSQTRRAQDAQVSTPTGQQLVPLMIFTNPVTLLPGAFQAAIETRPIRNLLLRRRAARDAREIARIDESLVQEMNRAGLLGAATTGAALSQNQNQERQDNGN